MLKKNIKIDIVSDIVCPWCKIGYYRLTKAVNSIADYEVQIAWHPFQLHPDIPEGGMEKSAFLQKKYGLDQLSPAVLKPVLDAAASENITIDFDKIVKAPNTIKAHRLMMYAAEQGKENESANALFNLYFVQGADIEDNKVLANTCQNLAMDYQDVITFLQSSKYRAEVLDDEKKWRSQGIYTVPTYVINDKYMIQGTQSSEAIINALNKIDPELSLPENSCQGDICAI